MLCRRVRKTIVWHKLTFALTLEAAYEHGLKLCFFDMHIAHQNTSAERNVQAEPLLCANCEAVSVKNTNFKRKVLIRCEKR